MTLTLRHGILLIATSALLAACSDKAADHQSLSAVPPVKGALVETVRASAIPEQVTAIGTVRAATRAVVAARIPGVVANQSVKEGARVKAGQLLMTLQAPEATAGAAGATAAVEEARQGLLEAQSRLKLAETTFARYDKLLAEQAVTRQEFDQRLSERDVANQAVARAEARLIQAREAATSARAVTGYSQITAPISGVVTSKSVDLGATVFPGVPLVTIEATGNYHLELAAPESLLGRINVGERVAVVIEGGATAPTGTVAEVVPMVDPATRTFTVKVAVTGTGLRSGQYGRGSFTTGSGTGMTVPKKAIQEKGALVAVWIVDQNQTARLRLIKTGRTLDERVEITAGLSDGDRVIVGGTWPTTEGAKIE